MATECSWNDGSKTQYYIVILDRLLGRSGGLEQAPEWRVRGPLTKVEHLLLPQLRCWTLTLESEYSLLLKLDH